MMQQLMRHQTTNNNKKQQVMDKKKKWKNQILLMVNSKTKTARPITLEALVQEQKLKLKIVEKKTI